MFSGIVEEVGRVEKFDPSNGELVINAASVLAGDDGLRSSDSISVSAHASPLQASCPTPSSSTSHPRQGAQLGSLNSSKALTSTSNELSNTTRGSVDTWYKVTLMARVKSKKSTTMVTPNS